MIFPNNVHVYYYEYIKFKIISKFILFQSNISFKFFEIINYKVFIKNYKNILIQKISYIFYLEKYIINYNTHTYIYMLYIYSFMTVCYKYIM